MYIPSLPSFLSSVHLMLVHYLSKFPSLNGIFGSFSCASLFNFQGPIDNCSLIATARLYYHKKPALSRTFFEFFKKSLKDFCGNSVRNRAYVYYHNKMALSTYFSQFFRLFFRACGLLQIAPQDVVSVYIYIMYCVEKPCVLLRNFYWCGNINCDIIFSGGRL